ncbi:MAG: Crp/Fnr family transcriptional regulator [Ferruginibacter sp.]
MQANIEEKLTKNFGRELALQMEAAGEIMDIPANTEIIKPGQYVRVVPLIITGAVKVFTGAADRELLLYYIQPNESCIMSFSACINHEKSKIHAVSEKESTILLLPSEKILAWISEYPLINMLFYRQYELRYTDLIDTINDLMYNRLDKRLLDYLLEKAAITGNNPVKLSHREIAAEMGTAREVISRLVKKMEAQQLVKQQADGIEIL